MDSAFRGVAATCLVALAMVIALPPATSAEETPTVDNVFFQTDLRQAIEDVAAQLGINIIADPSVQGIVSVTLEETPVEQALELLLAGTGYRYVRRPDYILVFNPDASADFFADISATRRVELQNLRPSAARGLLPEPLQRFVRIDEDSGRLVVTAPQELMNRILMEIEVVDHEEESVTTFVALEFVQAEVARLLLPEQMQRFVRVDPNRNSVVVNAPLDQRTEITALLRRLDRPTSPTSIETPDVYPTHRIDLSHGDANGILALLSDAHQAFVRADESTNMLAVSAPRHIVDGIIRDIRSLDRPRQHVMLEARVVVLERTDLLDFGTDFRWPTIEAGAFASDAVNGMPWELRIGYSPSRQFTNALSMSLNFLSANNQATIVSSPQVLAQDGLPAEIRVTTEEFFEIASDTTGIVRAQLEQIETGTILNITPRVASSGHMTLNMELEVSDVIGRGDNNLPVVSRRTASSTVRIENGGTAAVAGLADNRSQLRNRGTPVLRRLPLLGAAFGRDDLNHQARQVAIFVTATLVDADRRARRTGETRRNPIRNVSDDQYREELEAALHRMGRSID